MKAMCLTEFSPDPKDKRYLCSGAKIFLPNSAEGLIQLLRSN